MAKKCIPGVICVENMTLFFIFILLLVIAFLSFQSLGKSTSAHASSSVGILPPKHSAHPTVLNTMPLVPVQDVRGDVGRCTWSGGTVGDPMTNAYVPPVKCDGGGMLHAPMMMNIPSNAIPINVPTQHYNVSYSQVGILTKRYGNNNEILPLMGRRTVTSRDKWQYYTMSGGGAGGNLQTKLPVRTKGKNCSGEYGCDEIYSGDEVYVEGFQDMFQATIYDNGMFSYIPG